MQALFCSPGSPVQEFGGTSNCATKSAVWRCRFGHCTCNEVRTRACRHCSAHQARRSKSSVVRRTVQQSRQSGDVGSATVPVMRFEPVQAGIVLLTRLAGPRVRWCVELCNKVGSLEM